jgi:hypothetical protein
MILIEVARKDIVQKILGVVHFHLQLFEDYPFFLLDVFLAKQGIAHHVGQDIEGDGQVFVQNLGVVTHHLLGGESVQAAADGIHRAGDFLG